MIFFLHLASAFGELGESTLEDFEASGGSLHPNTLNILLNELTEKLSSDSLLVLDDFHIVSNVKDIGAFIRKLVDNCPPMLHIILASRHMPDYPEINRWRVKNKILFITSTDLAFTSDEIESLYRDQYDFPVTHEQAEKLREETSGWAIALQGIWQSLQSGIVSDIDAALRHLPTALDSFFDYLAPEVLARQPSYTQKFLLATSVLRQMDGSVCDALLETHDSESMLLKLHEDGLFVDAIGENTFSYQRLFHDFLTQQVKTKPSQYLRLHDKAAQYFRQTDQPEESIYHLMEAKKFSEALDLIQTLAPDLLKIGRQDTLANWINQVPRNLYEKNYSILLIQGDILRMNSNFDDALKYYKTAEKIARENDKHYWQSRALRLQAQVYLDTISPLKAQAFLEEAIRLLEPQEYRQEVAELLELLAENRLNFGFPDEARSLLQEAHLLQAETNPNDVYLEARALLRTGKLAAAQALLEAEEEPLDGKTLTRPQRGHRERSLLLSLICIQQGDDKAAIRYAQEGIRIGQQLKSDFVEAVGYMRLGHALQLNSYYPWGQTKIQKAVQCYQQSIERVKPFKIGRVGVEPMWGLCRVYGYSGVVSAAEPYAHRALEISIPAGDEWIGDLVKVNMGAAFAMQKQNETAIHWLEDASRGFIKVGDQFGRSAVLLWLALNAWWQNQPKTALDHMRALLSLVREHSYDFLLTRCTQLGIKDNQCVIPLLIEAWKENIEPDVALQALKKLGVDPSEIQGYHPGITLWIRTLGPFYAWRGDALVSNQDYKRDKARRLLQLLVTNRRKMLQRDQIIDCLWPDLPGDNALRDFKVALNALNKALEPDRTANEPPFFIVRKGEAYGLNPQARVMIDADQFEQLSKSKEMDDLAEAISLYEDDFLPDCPYKEWTFGERERLRHIYLVTAGKLAEGYLKNGQWENVVQIDQAILARDEYNERAIQQLMEAHAGAGNHSRFQETYKQATEKFKRELGEDLSRETAAVYQKLTKK